LFKESSVPEFRTSEEVEMHGGWAFTRGSYLSVLIPKDGRPAVEESGKYLEILKQQAKGAWKYYRTFGTVIANPSADTGSLPSH